MAESRGGAFGGDNEIPGSTQSSARGGEFGSGSTTSTSVSIRTGPQGPKGDKGDTGAQGSEGPTGQTGATGAQGNSVTGPAGPTGAMGTTGSQGATGGVGPAGAQGTTGTTGATGSQGIQGDIGPTGPAGTTGAQGIQGDPGAMGATGSQGIQGAQGPVGQTGAQGTMGTTGSQGAMGIQGDQGLTGATGAQGPSVQSDWDQTDTTALDYVENKPTLDEIDEPTTSVDMSAERIIDLADPVNPQDAATRAYVLAHSGGTGPVPVQSQLNLAVTPNEIEVGPSGSTASVVVVLSTNTGFTIQSSTVVVRDQQNRVIGFSSTSIDTYVFVVDSSVQGSIHIAASAHVTEDGVSPVVTYTDTRNATIHINLGWYSGLIDVDPTALADLTDRGIWTGSERVTFTAMGGLTPERAYIGTPSNVNVQYRSGLLFISTSPVITVDNTNIVEVLDFDDSVMGQTLTVEITEV